MITMTWLIVWMPPDAAAVLDGAAAPEREPVDEEQATRRLAQAASATADVRA